MYELTISQIASQYLQEVSSRLGLLYELFAAVAWSVLVLCVWSLYEVLCVFAAVVSGDTPEEITSKVKGVIGEQSGPMMWIPAKELLWMEESVNNSSTKWRRITHDNNRSSGCSHDERSGSVCSRGTQEQCIVMTRELLMSRPADCSCWLEVHSAHEEPLHCSLQIHELCLGAYGRSVYSWRGAGAACIRDEDLVCFCLVLSTDLTSLSEDIAMTTCVQGRGHQWRSSLVAASRSTMYILREANI